METTIVKEFGVSVSGRDYYVNSAEVSFEVSAVDYTFDARSFTGRDTFARVAHDIVAMEIVNDFSEDEVIVLADLPAIREAIFERFAEENSQVAYGRWM
jgi:hypothetical protein